MNEIVRAVKKLHLPTGQYSVVGGGALAARGLRPFNDVDLIVTPDLYEKLKNSGGWEEREKRASFYHIYLNNSEAAKDFSHIEGCNLRTLDVIKNSEIIDGVPFMSLNDLFELKRAMGREKDLKDIELITDYLKRNNANL
jgi:hypothetical protein